MSEFIDIKSKYYPQKLNEISLAIVGTRNITNYGIKYAKEFTKEIALRDIVVVSGMAKGTDRIAHEETLNAGGKTIAVMGTGFNRVYPDQNIDIYERIINENGLIITEYEDNVEFKTKNFPYRNRIVSGLSEGVLVIEGAYRSGTSITANLAWQQKKKVYALPGRLDSSYGVGVNMLIQKGAKLVMNINDILIDFPELLKRKKRIIIHNNKIKQEYRKIYELLGDIPISLEEISMKTRNNIRCTAKLLTLMEIEDLVEQIIGVRVYKENWRMIIKR